MGYDRKSGIRLNCFTLKIFVTVYFFFFPALRFFVLFGITEKVVTVFASVRFEFEKKKICCNFFFSVF